MVDDFLKEVELDSDNRSKTINFSKDEEYLLKFVKFKNRKFSEYVKSLMKKDVEDFAAKNIDEDKIRRIVREEIKRT